jgi:hypothetical protein
MSGNLGEKALKDLLLPPFPPVLLFLMFQIARIRSAISFWSDIVFGVSESLVTSLFLASSSIVLMIRLVWRMLGTVEIYFALKDWKNLNAIRFYPITVEDLTSLLLRHHGSGE